MEDIKPPIKSAFVYPWPFPVKDNFITKIKNRFITTLVFSASKLLFFGGVNKIQVNGREKFIKCLEDKNKPLITISNHRCNIDDPLMWTFLSYPEFFKNISRFRYILAASNICFTNPLYTKIFAAGRCVPCVRGEGVYQAGMEYCLEKLNEKGWVHIFPEGRVETLPIRIKWGVGRLVMDCNELPTILPIWIKGMDHVWPTTKPYRPRFGKIVKMDIGDPIDLTPYIKAIPGGLQPIEKRKIITDILQEKLFATGNTVLGEEPKY
uniref:Tafazzin family protein n=1 Tax=Parastrongyloides trichosuri TaxID=131310 RepID=A0A0N4ZJA3_PARTI